MDNKPTKRQIDCLMFIYYYNKIHGRTPNELQIMEYFKSPPPNIHKMIGVMEKKGYIQRTPDRSRAIRIAIPDDQFQALKREAKF